MSMGLLALLDDVAVFVKVAAASLDDVGAQATKAGTKAAAVVIDDAAVTPKYVVGFSAQRELPIIWKIAVRSLKNKLLILLPITVAIDYFAPWLMTPILMLGGTYLCYEGAEKIFETVFPHPKHIDSDTQSPTRETSEDLEQKTIDGAVRTDFILSAEIMAISMSTVAEALIQTKIIVLIIMAAFLTIAVYGVVAIIVKMDDLGLAMNKNQLAIDFCKKTIAKIGRGLVLGMPHVLLLLTIIGTVAMTWVGGSIVAHGLAAIGLTLPEDMIHSAAEFIKHNATTAVSFLEWLTTALLQSVFGITIGFLTMPLVHQPQMLMLRKNKIS